MTGERKHTVEVIKEFKLGFADGNLTKHIMAKGFSLEDIKKTGLTGEQGKDFFIQGLILFPHFVNGKFSHFTIKDPEKKTAYQMRKEFWDNHWRFFNQRVLGNREVILVEGENDLLSIYDKAGLKNVVAIIGSLSGEQIEYLKRYSKDKALYLCFDNDDAGKNYTRKLIEQLPETDLWIIPFWEHEEYKAFNDIDELLCKVENPETVFKHLYDNAVDGIEYEINQISETKFLGKTLRHKILPLLIPLDSPLCQDYLKIIKKKFKLTARDIEAYRKTVNQMKEEYEKVKQVEATSKVETEDRDGTLMTDEEKEKALAYLKDKKLLPNIEEDLTKVGIIGEDINKVMLYLAALSRKFKRPISIIIFAKSSTGKSYLAIKIGLLTPPEDRLILSSASTRSLDYIEENAIKHKYFLIQEIQGAEEILPTIRILQSEGILERLVTIIDPVTNRPKAISDRKECPACVVMTTTKDYINNENSTRIFELYADESVEQTQRVVDFNFQKETLEWKLKQKEIEEIFKLHHNIQRLLKSLEVVIPYAKHLTFPHKATRNRRDSERFLSLIKVIAFLRQYQKEVKKKGGIEYIEADLPDYAYGYEIGIKVLANTLDDISERARKVLEVCCHLDNSIYGKHFTLKDIQNKAKELDVDLSNISDLRKQVKSLVYFEYLEQVEGGQGKTGKYKTSTDYEYADGEIKGIERPNVDILTPEELERKIDIESID